jgi:hypothetical protein
MFKSLSAEELVAFRQDPDWTKMLDPDHNTTVLTGDVQEPVSRGAGRLARIRIDLKCWIRIITQLFLQEMFKSLSAEELVASPGSGLS